MASDSNKVKFNNVSDERIKEIRKMFPFNKGLLTFRLLNGQTLKLPNQQGQMEIKTFYPSVQLRPTDRIIDKDGESIDIKCVKGTNNGDPVLDYIFIPDTQSGFFTVHENKVDERHRIDFLLLGNRFKDNPFRDESVTAEYELVDKIAKAKHSNKIRSDKALAYQFQAKMTEQEMKDFAAAMNWDEHADIEEVKELIGDMIDRDASEFIKSYENPDIEYRTVLKRAITAGIVTWSPTEYKLTIKGGASIALDRVHNETYFDAFVNWVNEKQNGEETFNVIKGLLYPKAQKSIRFDKKPPAKTDAQPDGGEDNGSEKEEK